ncbi:ABC transporter substrate-binding protein [Candidatus Xianfuyuplasma coldseepsis]|uniref:ABC transporter substrate-binding protein n=1 Tax=Candidatus Xianfuyuplasma coldseepsis TaxID=2782163 RepID=A0A7L7KSG8_9MOLU|nr:ABC transporter substrate-binding protein [Xianfuyuplasma coldseepsis]QMS85683.1 ABC transporter substrate-binding protein [Xianfuyuplasma coldseepsis]
MKKIMLLLAIGLMVSLAFNVDAKEVSAMTTVYSGETLYVLNWGEYMDPELVEQFETTFDVTVVYDEVGSNEEMEVRIKAGTTKYDVAFPSDYMIDKLRQQNLLNEIDHTKLTGLSNVTIKPEVASLTEGKGYDSYFIPYFWGTIGIMYNTDSVDEADLTGWEVLFDTDSSYRIGMYNSARDAAAAALLYLGYDVNTNDEDELSEAEDALRAMDYSVVGEDNLKTLVQSGNLDMALVYSGDYFDTLYIAEEEEADINFGFYVPDTTNVWVDGFVIPTTSENTDLAHEFINFFLDEAVAEQNADWVGYAPVLDEVFDTLTNPDGDYGYDYDNYDPYPAGSSRVIYEYISDARFQRLNELLDAAKASDIETGCFSSLQLSTFVLPAVMTVAVLAVFALKKQK